MAQSKGLQALQKQADYASLQRVGGTFWDPATNFGTIMSQGNPGGKNLQTLLNEMVTDITGTESTGDPEGVESTEETGEETTEENAEGESDVAEETAETSEEEASDESAEADSAESE